VVFWRRHPELGPFLGVGPEGPPPLPAAGRQRRRERLVRALQNLPLKLPALWEETLRYHYIRGLHRAWSELGDAGPAGGGAGEAKGVAKGEVSQ
jgi:hypothetical protein